MRGLIHALRTPGELAALAPGSVVVEGIIVDENVARAPRCALHPAGKADGDGCAPEIPSFWLADDASPQAERIRVLGWASSFSQVIEAQRLGRASASGGKPAKLWRDERWGNEVPWPLPTKGKRVRVRGTYASHFDRIAGGTVSEPRTGLLALEHIEPLEAR